MIVIVVIGILAAISIVAYNGIQNRANNTSIQTDLRNVGQQVAMLKATDDQVPLNEGGLQALRLKVTGKSYLSSGQSLIYCADSVSLRYVFGGISASGQGYVYDSQNGTVTARSAWTGGMATVCPALMGYSTNVVGAWGYTSDGGWRSWAGYSA